MTHGISVRPATIGDMRPAYGLFRRSLYDYLFRLAQIDEGTARNPPIEEAWARQSAWIEHLWDNAAENWVAVDGGGQLVGWAMSVERDGHLELTHFFVAPDLQAKGIGRSLFARAFPSARAARRSILATQDTRALSLYLRSGVHYVTTSAEFVVAAERVAPSSDLVFEPASPGRDSVQAIADIKQAVLGYRREVDTQFLIRSRPAWVVRRPGRVVGFAFGAQPKAPDNENRPAATGPVGALDAQDLPAILDYVIDAAARAEFDRVSFLVPLVNHSAVSHLLSWRGAIDPFYVKVLASGAASRLDR